MGKKLVSMMLATVMSISLLAGCGSSSATTEGTKDTETAEASTSTKETADAGEILEFYHGYYHDESEWPAAKVMRDIYDEFAAQHADGPVTFKPIAVENRFERVSAQVAGGSFPDIVDCDQAVPAAAISQELVYDLKPFIDENNMQDAVGLNYTQNDIGGHIYTVHDQIESRGMWYNADVFEAAGISAEDMTDWDAFGMAMEKVRALGDGTYGYAAGQGSKFIVNAILASSEEGRALVSVELTEEGIKSEVFAEAFKMAAALDQANGSDHTTVDVGNLMDDFNKNGKAAVLFNGVWNASGISEELIDAINPTIFPGDVAVASAGAGLAVSNTMSEAKTGLALEFIKYMTSPEVQAKIFTGVQANPCNTTVDLEKLASENGDAATLKLAEACAQINNATYVVKDLNQTWGTDVGTAIINALMECAVSGADIDVRFEQLQKELIALIG